MEEATGQTVELADMIAPLLPSAKMQYLLLALGEVRTEAEVRAAPFKANIEAESVKMGEAIEILLVRETKIKAAIEDCLEHEFKDDNCKYKGEAGTAQIVKPKPRITYDVKGLETLRLSSDETDRLLGHLRSEKPSKPYLRVKLK